MKKITFIIGLLASALYLLPSCGGENKEQTEETFAPIPVTYPNTQTVDQQDDYHGTMVADPYRWLEYDTAENVKAWVTEENNVTFGYLDQIPFRNSIKERLTDIFNYNRYSSAFGRYVIKFKAGGKYFFTKNDGLQNQGVIYVQSSLTEEPEVFIDPNTLTEDGTAAVTLISASKDSKYMVYGINKAGSDWQDVFVMDLETKEKTGDVISWAKFSGAAWKGNGFYYSRYPAPEKGKEFSNVNEYHRIYYHTMGEDQSKDRLVYEDMVNPKRYHSADITDDERYLLIYISEGTDGTEILCRDLANGQKDFTKVFDGFENNAVVVGTYDGKLLMKTDKGALNQTGSIIG